jgi:NADH-quinone oxidoreductase subunit E
VNWEFFDNMTPQSARDLVDGLRAGAPVMPTRGAPRLCSWKQASRILAGFPDGQAPLGNKTGDASLAGLRIAREQGWTPESGPAATGGGGRAAGNGRQASDNGGQQ